MGGGVASPGKRFDHATEYRVVADSEGETISAAISGV
jgi:hypothetical protein